MALDVTQKAMSEQNNDNIKPLDGVPTQELSYDELTEASVQDLFARFKKMGSNERINVVSAVCLAKALSNQSGLTNEDARLEYLKEYGRNERAVLKSDGSGGSEDDDPLFSR